MREEGLFDRNRTLELPFLPKRLGILTSAGGTVINDFRNSLDQSEFGFELFWCSVSVQGAEAKTDILRGLHRLEALALDAILIFRGGGSAADLAVFNEYEVAKAVCLCKVPVISAIGHQDDQSSLQDVSYLAFGVPKDIGRFFADIVLEHRAEVDEIIQLLIRRTTELLQSQSDRVLQVTRHIHLQAASGLAGKEEFCKRMTIELPRLTERSVQDGVRALTSVAQPICLLSAQRCEYHLRRCEDVARSLRQASRVIWQRFVDRVDYLEKLVVGASPETQLKRGFTLIRRVKATSSKEEIVTMAAEIQSGEDIEVQFYDSVRKARVLE